MLRFLLNVLWFILGGLVMGLGLWLAGVVCALTIVGIPWVVFFKQMAQVDWKPEAFTSRLQKSP